MAREPRTGPVGLRELLAANGVEVHDDPGGSGGSCPRCHQPVRVDLDAEQWSCGCGSGGPAEWVALSQGVSVSHAAELLRTGWHPDGDGGIAGASTGERTVRILPPLCAADADDQILLDAVVSHYQHALPDSATARTWLDRLGIDDALAARLRLGYANRTLGYRLPEANRKTGARLRSQLIRLGLYRSSGHEHLTGCLTVPITTEGRIVGVCGYRLGDGGGQLWATGLPGGMFGDPRPVGGELLLVESVRDALAVLAAGHDGVVAPGRPTGLTRADIHTLARLGVHRATVIGESADGLPDRLRAEGITARIVTPGAPVAELLASARDPLHALHALLTPDAAKPARTGDDTAAPADPCQQPETTPADAAPPAATTADGCRVSGDVAELHVAFDARRWRVRGADRNRVPDALRVALSVTDTSTGAFHLDTVDLYAAKNRAAFLDAASAELSANPNDVRRELAEVLFATEAALAAVDDLQPVDVMSEADRDAGMDLLRDPRLADRVVEDLGALGVVGEQTNLLVAYLATVSRKAERPFGVVIQSSSAAGKSTLADAVCALVPEEDLASFSALTGQALYYLGGQALAHKVLAVAEETGASRAAYALKLLVTEGQLTIASTGKDPSGRLRTTRYAVAGPVALVLTTTATDIDPELANRVIVLGVDEEVAQTRAIHTAQRKAVTLDGLLARLQRDNLLEVHRNAQRLLEPLPVVIPDAEALTFPAHAVRHRRDHQKLLGLITASALLHQHQRPRGSIDVNGQTVAYVEADPADVALALRLAETVLARGGDELAPQTRRLLAAAEQLVATKTAETAAPHNNAAPRAVVSFYRRELRELLGCTEHQIRAGLARLVALEYVTVLPGPVGCQHRYTLIDPPISPDGPSTFPSPGEPGGTLRRPGEPSPLGPSAPRPAQIPDPAAQRAATGHVDGEPPVVVVPVGVDVSGGAAS